MKELIIKNKQLYSFDIFDTLITRTVATPLGIFSIIQRKLCNDILYKNIPQFLKDNFYDIRVGSEMYCRANKFLRCNTSEITLEEIYEVMSKNQGLTKNQIEKLINLEINIELQNIVPISKNIDKLKSFVNEGKRVVLISDMYLSSKRLKYILSHIDPIFSEIKIYVSNEYGCDKVSGQLYKFVAKEEDVQFNSWLHFGDNIVADVKSAKLNRIKTEHLPQEDFLPYENFYLWANLNNVYLQGQIGCAKLTRTLSTDKSDAYKFGCSYASIILYNYVNWLLEQSIKRGFKTLHFIARDGFVLKEIADIIIQTKNLDIKTRYIYGSRLAWRIPDESNFNNYINWIFSEYLHLFNINFLVSRLNITREELNRFIKISDYSGVIKNKNLEKLKRELLHNTNLKDYIIKKNVSKKELLIKYFKESIDFSSENIVFVDVNGSGRTQDLISTFINSTFGNKKVAGFYFHLETNSEQNESPKFAYISTTNFHSSCIELLCRALHGQTLGYERSNDKIVPIFEPYQTQKLLDWGYESYLQGIKDFTSNMLDFENRNDVILDSYEPYKMYFKFFMNHLDNQTANIIGGIPYSSVGAEQYLSECAPEYNIKDAIGMLLMKHKIGKFSFISYARSNKLIKKIIKFKEKYGSLRKFIINIYVNKKCNVAYFRFMGVKISLRKLLCIQ